MLLTTLNVIDYDGHSGSGRRASHSPAMATGRNLRRSPGPEPRHSCAAARHGPQASRSAAGKSRRRNSDRAPALNASAVGNNRFYALSIPRRNTGLALAIDRFSNTFGDRKRRSIFDGISRSRGGLTRCQLDEAIQHNCHRRFARIRPRGDGKEKPRICHHQGGGRGGAGVGTSRCSRIRA